MSQLSWLLVQGKCRELEALQYKADMLESKDRESMAKVNALSAENIGFKTKLAVRVLSVSLLCFVSLCYDKLLVGPFYFSLFLSSSG